MTFQDDASGSGFAARRSERVAVAVPWALVPRAAFHGSNAEKLPRRFGNPLRLCKSYYSDRRFKYAARAADALRTVPVGMTRPRKTGI